MLTLEKSLELNLIKNAPNFNIKKFYLGACPEPLA